MRGELSGLRWGGAIAVALAVLARPVAATEDPPPPSPDQPAAAPVAVKDAPDEEAEFEIEAVDSAHAAVSRSVADVADRIDSFFVDERVDEAYNRTRFLVRAGPRIRARDGVEADVSFRLNLSLPRTNKRIGLFAGGGLNNAETLDEQELDNRDGDGVGVGLRFFLLDRAKAQLNLDGGLRFRPQPDPFTRIRAVRPFFLGGFILRPTQFLFWELEDGVGEKTRFDFDRRLGERFLGRLRAALEWSEVTHGVEPQGQVFLFQKLGDRSALRYRFRVKGETHPASIVTSYFTSVRYRRLLYKKWLYGEVEPGALFKDEDDWKFSPEVTLRVEIQFGRGFDPDRRTRRRDD